MGDFNKLSGDYELPLPDNGTLYVSRRVTNQIKANYEDWLEGNARCRAFQLHQNKQLTEAQFKITMRSIDASSGASTFSWGGDALQESLRQIPGIVKLTCLLAADASTRHPNQAIDESKVLGFMRNPAIQEMLSGIIEELIKADPNFLDPPVRATG